MGSADAVQHAVGHVVLRFPQLQHVDGGTDLAEMAGLVVSGRALTGQRPVAVQQGSDPYLAPVSTCGDPGDPDHGFPTAVIDL